MTLYLDTESVGLVGPTVLVQWARDGGEVHLHEVFNEPIQRTLNLCELLTQDRVCTFNGTHDWFHVSRLHGVLSELVRRGADPSRPPTVYGWFEALRPAVATSLCLKPPGALDLMLYARKGPAQSLMERDDIRVRRVPAVLAEDLCGVLSERLDLPSIYFARKKDQVTWKVEQDPDDPDFPAVYLSFGASGGLKALAKHVLGVETIDYPIPKDYYPDQASWDLFKELPHELVHWHVAYWQVDETARRYAQQDVDLLRMLESAWNPPWDDDDSVLAYKVGAARWCGWRLDLQQVDKHLYQARIDMELAPRAPEKVLATLKELAGPAESAVIENTSADTLELLKKVHGKQQGDHYAPADELGDFVHRVTLARSAEKRADLLWKLQTQGRAHFDFKVIGALSGRSAGAGGINPQGIERGELRFAFLLADHDAGEELEGGDFDGFEVTIADAVYQDPALRADLLAGKKIHAMLGADMYAVDPDFVKQSDKNNPDRVADPDGRGWDGDLYNPAKHGVFTMIYGGQAMKVGLTMGLTEEDAEAGMERFFQRYPLVGAGMLRAEQLFCSMTQPVPGGRVIWREPAEYAESLLGFRRYFTLENRLVKLLYNLAQKPPEVLRRHSHLKVRRRIDKLQTPGGAVMSALFGAAFQVQARNMRAARNHEIQSTGAGVTKRLERRVWDHQPVGIHPWRVRPYNVHDEVVSPTRLDLTDTVNETVESYRSVIPLIKMKWKRKLASWGHLK